MDLEDFRDPFAAILAPPAQAPAENPFLGAAADSMWDAQAEEGVLVGGREPPVQAARAPRNTIYKTLNVRIKTALVKEHFGTLTPTPEQIAAPAVSVRKLSQQHGYAFATLHRIMRKYVASGFQVTEGRPGAGRTVTHMPPDVRDLLLSKETLEEQLLFSLEKRCLWLQVAGEFNMTPSRLRRFYKFHGVHYMRPQTAYKSELNWDQEELKRLRIDFAGQLYERMTTWPEGVIYIDEAS